MVFEAQKYFGVDNFGGYTATFLVLKFWCLRLQIFYFEHQFWCLKPQKLFMKSNLNFVTLKSQVNLFSLCRNQKKN